MAGRKGSRQPGSGAQEGGSTRVRLGRGSLRLCTAADRVLGLLAWGGCECVYKSVCDKEVCAREHARLFSARSEDILRLYIRTPRISCLCLSLLPRLLPLHLPHPTPTPSCCGALPRAIVKPVRAPGGVPGSLIEEGVYWVTNAHKGRRVKVPAAPFLLATFFRLPPHNLGYRARLGVKSDRDPRYWVRLCGGLEPAVLG